uniref:Transcobalamin-like C-terminal domain-containing protein n=1 Tax=Oryzias latipes TaxID=8090 RepID=A0A3P9HHT2_ORYLA
MAFRVIFTAAVLILLTQAGDEGDDEGANSDRGSHAGAAALLRHSETLRQSKLKTPVFQYSFSRISFCFNACLFSDNNLDPITIVVKNNFQGVKKTYNASVAYRGILIGAMKRLRKSNTNFKFTYKEDLNYGPYLESINGVPGKTEDHTYWELLVIKPNGSIVTPDVGIGCYIPSPNEQILFNFTKW